MDLLLKYQLIDFQSLLLIQYKQLELNENEAMVLMLVLQLEKQKQAINVDVLDKYMSLDRKNIDIVVRGLLNKELLCIEGYQISSKPLIMRLLEIDPDEKKETKKTLVEIFESEFNRPLSGIEIETLKQWKQQFYSDEMIIDALKEATLSNVKNFRYIGKILTDWARHGVKKSGRALVESDNKVELTDYDFLGDLL